MSINWKRNNRFILTVILIIAAFSSVALGWDNKTTHIDLSDEWQRVRSILLTSLSESSGTI